PTSRSNSVGFECHVIRRVNALHERVACRARIDRPAHAFRCALRNVRSLPKTLNPQMLMNGQTDEILRSTLLQHREHSAPTESDAGHSRESTAQGLSSADIQTRTYSGQLRRTTRSPVSQSRR